MSGEYPKLMWHKENRNEVTVHSRNDELDHMASYQALVPIAIPKEGEDEEGEGVTVNNHDPSKKKKKANG